MSASSLAGVLKKNDGQTGTAQASGQQARRAGQAGASSKVTVSKAFGGADAAAMGKQVRAACGTLTVRTVAASAPYGCSLCSVRLQPLLRTVAGGGGRVGRGAPGGGGSAIGCRRVLLVLARLLRGQGTLVTLAQV